ncbi:hypothetical protein K501DRAFT_276044 [Backusella circina FSU 941]|nr:hypothetical protein K501DRAFT_276044 [Backusella circina FSU 941]
MADQTEKAVAWFRFSYKKDSVSLSKHIGDMYHEGKDVKADYSMVFELYLKATDKREKWAALELSEQFKYGFDEAYIKDTKGLGTLEITETLEAIKAEKDKMKVFS